MTTHERRISINGYTGEGYIILNDRGTGAWMINGGLYGGMIALAQQAYLAIVLFGSNQNYYGRVIAKEIIAKQLKANLLQIAKSFAQIAAIAGSVQDSVSASSNPKIVS